MCTFNESWNGKQGRWTNNNHSMRYVFIYFILYDHSQSKREGQKKEKERDGWYAACAICDHGFFVRPNINSSNIPFNESGHYWVVHHLIWTGSAIRQQRLAQMASASLSLCLSFTNQLIYKHVCMHFSHAYISFSMVYPIMRLHRNYAHHSPINAPIIWSLFVWHTFILSFYH